MFAQRTSSRSQANPNGGVIKQEMPIHMSNVSPVVEGKPARVRFETQKDGAKVRIGRYPR